MSTPTTGRARLLAEIVGKGLRRARVAAKIRGLHFATLLGVQAPYVSMVETGKENISPVQVERWCALLGVDPADIYPKFQCPQCGHHGVDWTALARLREEQS